MAEKDVRWQQRLQNFKKAFSRLKGAVQLAEDRELTELEKQGLIQSFEFTHELAWNTMKDFLAHRGVRNLYGSKDTTREAFKKELIENGQAWMDMIRDRNLTSHTYDEETAEKIATAILTKYVPEFAAFEQKMDSLAGEGFE